MAPATASLTVNDGGDERGAQLATPVLVNGADGRSDGYYNKRVVPALQPEAALNEPAGPMSLGEIARHGWFLFTFQKGKQLLATTLGALPVSIAFALIFCVPLTVPPGSDGGMPFWVGFLIFDAAFFAYLPSIIGAVACLTSAAHNGEPITILTAYRRTWSHYGVLFVVFLGTYAATVVGLFCFIVPGIWFLARYGLA